MERASKSRLASSDNITTTGIIIPIDWDEHGNPVTIALSAYDEHEYLIDELQGKGKELQKMLQPKIKVDGVLGSLIANRRKIIIKSYILL